MSLEQYILLSNLKVDTYVDGVLIAECAYERKSARRMGRKHLDTCPHVLACFHGFFFPLAKETANYSGCPPVLKFYYEDLC